MRPVPPERRAAAQRFCWLVAKICKRHPNLVIMRCFVVITRCCSHNYKMLSHIAATGAYLMCKYKTTSKQNSNDHPANFETEAELWCVCFVPCWYSKQHFVEFLRGWWGRIFTLYKVMLPPMANTFFFKSHNTFTATGCCCCCNQSRALLVKTSKITHHGQDTNQNIKSVPRGQVAHNERVRPPTWRNMKRLVLAAMTRPRRSQSSASLAEPFLAGGGKSSGRLSSELHCLQRYMISTWVSHSRAPALWSFDTFLMSPFKGTRSL